MKTLIIYYSYDGNSAFVADIIKEKTQADMLRLEIENEKHEKGFLKYVWGVKQVFSKKTPVLKPYNVNFEQYDLMIFGCPVWASAPAPAMRAFLEQIPVSGKKTAVFCCHAGGKGQSLETMKSLLSQNNTVIGEIDFVNPSKMDKKEAAEKIRAWVERLAV
jgi:flavodoxin